MAVKARVRLWVQALKSGRYKQGTLALRTGPKYCCLGVACAVYRRETGRGRWDRDGEFEVDGAMEYATLPAAVQAWYGLPSDNPKLGDASATARNDDSREDFSTIARAIRTEYLT